MRKLTTDEVQSLQGGGCYKYMRRHHRANKRKEFHVAADYLSQYYECMGIDKPTWI